MKKYFNGENMVAFIALISLFIIFTITSKFKLVSAYNLKTIFDQAIPIIIGGLGVIFVISIGGIDLSIGASAAVASTIGCIVGEKYGVWGMVICTVLICLIVGLINGVITSYFKVSSFMCTLAMLIGLRGILNYLVSKGIILAPSKLLTVNELPYRLIILFILTIIITYIFEYTRFGVYCKAMGENETTVMSIGINVKKVRIIAFVLSGLMGGVLGILQMASLGGASASIGQFMEMKIMMAIFLGGVLVTGGLQTKVYKLFIGAFSISVITNGLLISGIDTNYFAAIQGILLMVVLYANIYFNKKSKNINNEEKVSEVQVLQD